MMMKKKMIFGAIGGMNLEGETEVFGGNLPRRHFVHHKIPHDDPVSNPGPQRWEKCDNWFGQLQSGKETCPF
jgi:hypothetical protein